MSTKINIDAISFTKYEGDHYGEYMHGRTMYVAELADGSELHIVASYMDGVADANVQLLRDGKVYTSESPQDYPEIETVFPREYWYAGGCGKRVGITPHPVFEQAIIDYWGCGDGVAYTEREQLERDVLAQAEKLDWCDLDEVRENMSEIIAFGALKFYNTAGNLAWAVDPQQIVEGIADYAS